MRGSWGRGRHVRQSLRLHPFPMPHNLHVVIIVVTSHAAQRSPEAVLLRGRFSTRLPAQVVLLPMRRSRLGRLLRREIICLRLSWRSGVARAVFGLLFSALGYSTNPQSLHKSIDTAPLLQLWQFGGSPVDLSAQPTTSLISWLHLLLGLVFMLPTIEACILDIAVVLHHTGRAVQCRRVGPSPCCWRRLG